MRFLTEASARPGWLDGNFANVGSLGRVVRSFNNGSEGEIRANASLAFGEEYLRSQSKRWLRRRAPASIGNGLTIAARRLFADGEGQVRLEVLASDSQPGSSTLEDRLDQLLTTPVYVVRESRTELISAGFYVARLYLSQSDKTIDPRPISTSTKLLQEGAGSPFVVVIHMHPPGPDPDGTPLENAPFGLGAVTCRLVELAGRTTGVWQLWGAAGKEWLPAARMLCRIICQLSEVTSLINLKQDPEALAPHLLDRSALDRFLRIRSGQLRRKIQGGWPVPDVQRLAAQHLKANIEDAAQGIASFDNLVRRDVARDMTKTMERVKKDSEKNMMLKSRDRQILAEILAAQALNQPNYFRNLLIRANLPPAFKQQRQDAWTNDNQTDAFMLIDWAQSKGTNPIDPGNTVLASVLLPELRNLGPEDTSTIVAAISAYHLVNDELALATLRMRYQCPVAKSSTSPSEDVGPNFTWRGETDEIQLQSWLRKPPDFLDVGYLRKAIQHATSVCLIEVGNTGHTGTGVVIHDHYVLTNYHVIQSMMLEHGPAPEAARIYLKFASYGDETPCRTISLDTNQPIVSWSPVAKLDYALLKAPQLSTLAEVRPATISLKLPALRSFLSILQHPNGGSMQLASSVDAVTFCDPDSGIIQYITRTASGSSGAPCFDENWNLVGLHHAERSRPFGTIREGILISSIVRELKQWIG
ncbi:trypsin-like peptidase domain-containing protein [Bradyrhizobium sp. 83012]|uniref:Trypsin-like peptidase domain-containing protein n=1 Tax=Bradyrhizobium aeschynomenes TaxID=2734909 RepID=A0ABX2C8D1_9BRAD|nr:serine protease [Bradyrhizobium aeschynomenes]NPU63622.1 trypsin-like peptidase domain-containing protein [Bradyrhizobium aeschynomenes]